MGLFLHVILGDLRFSSLHQDTPAGGFRHYIKALSNDSAQWRHVPHSRSSLSGCRYCLKGPQLVNKDQLATKHKNLSAHDTLG